MKRFLVFLIAGAVTFGCTFWGTTWLYQVAARLPYQPAWLWWVLVVISLKVFVLRIAFEDKDNRRLKLVAQAYIHEPWLYSEREDVRFDRIMLIGLPQTLWLLYVIYVFLRVLFGGVM